MNMILDWNVDFRVEYKCEFLFDYELSLNVRIRIVYLDLDYEYFSSVYDMLMCFLLVRFS